MAMYSLNQAALQIIAKLGLKSYSVTPAILCEWSRQSDGKMLTIHVPYKGNLISAEGDVITIDQPRYFKMTAEALFEFEVSNAVQITTLSSGEQHYVVEPKTLIKLETLRVEQQEVADLILSIQAIEQRQQFSIAEESDSIELDSAQHQVESFLRDNSSQFPLLTQIIEQGQHVKIGNDAVHALVVAMDAEQAQFWTLLAPTDDDVLTQLIYSILHDRHDQGEPIPQVREVMNLCKQKNKYGVLIIANEIKYLDHVGKMQRANTATIQKRIDAMAVMQVNRSVTNIAA